MHRRAQCKTHRTRPDFCVSTLHLRNLLTISTHLPENVADDQNYVFGHALYTTLIRKRGTMFFINDRTELRTESS
jgi:hypothetical protein